MKTGSPPAGKSSDYKKLARLAKSLNLREIYVITKNFRNEKYFIPVQDI